MNRFQKTVLAVMVLLFWAGAARAELEIKKILSIPIAEVKKPAGLAVDKAGWIYLTDAVSGEGMVYNRDGEFRFRFGKTDKKILNIPWAIEVSATALIYVTDIGSHSVKVFDLRGVFQFEFGSPGEGRGQFNKPYALAFDSKGNVYAADNGNCRIQVFDARGNYKTQFGQKGRGPGQFGSPVALAIDKDDNIYVVDSLNCEVQVFDSGGNFILKMGSSGARGGQLIDPQGIAIDKYGLVYVSDSGNYRVQIFSSRGVYLAEFKGRAGLFTPGRIKMFMGENLFLIDKDSKTIDVYKEVYTLSAIKKAVEEGKIGKETVSEGGGKSLIEELTKDLPSDIDVDDPAFNKDVLPGGGADLPPGGLLQ